MRITFLVLLLTAFTATASAQWGWNKRVRGNGDVKTETREVSPFTGISSCCKINIKIEKGPQELRIEAESNLLEYLETEVTGGRLRVGFKDNSNISPKEAINVYITVPTIDFLGASSGCQLYAVDNFSGEELEADASSGGKITANFTGRMVRSEASSGGHVYLSGKTERIRAGASSGAGVHAAKMTATRAKANASSGGGVKLYATGELDASASSGGKIRYQGGAKLDADTSSGGSVRGSK